MVDEYRRKDARGQYRPLGLRNRNQAFNPITRPKLYYPLYVNSADCTVSPTKAGSHTIEVWPDAPDGTKTCWTWGADKVKKEGSILFAEQTTEGWRIYRKDYLLNAEGDVAKTLVKSLWTDKEITNDYGRKAIKDLFGSAVMDFPKSPELLTKIVQMGSGSESLILDFFAGSSSTADAIMHLNAEDGGNRRFIMVQLDEECAQDTAAFKAGYKTIAEISKERIRRAGKKISESNPQVDTGFRVLKIDTSNMADVYYTPDAVTQEGLFAAVDNIKPDRTAFDLLFQVMLDWGVDLALPIEKKAIQGKDVYFVDGNALAACFDHAGGIDDTFAKELAKHQPLRAVFRDAGFKDSTVKINIEQIFKLISPATEVKCL